MVAKRIFDCNLCGGCINVGNLGRGIKFAHNGLVLVDLAAAEAHLCERCADGLRAAWAPPSPVECCDTDERATERRL